jgi:hypothetical protein
MKIKLNQIFSTEVNPKYINWEELTRGKYTQGLNLYKGMPYFKENNNKTPLINFHTNPFKEDEEQSPWRDLIFQEEGRVMYNGDNKSSEKRANETYGNKKVLENLSLYFSKNRIERLKAPPILVTKTIKIGTKTGFRQFIGIGIINEPPVLVHQYEKSSNNVFTNYQFEITLISLAPDDTLNWDWIDDRRNKNISDEDSLKNAPKNWIRWVQEGSDIVSKIQLKIKSYRLINESEQRDLQPKNKKLVYDLLNIHYPDPISDGIRFEALASFITTLYFSDKNYFRGWITVGSGDRGVDFVGRLDIGHDSFSNTSIIVLGQSKRYKNSISGERLTRVASRMTRGYIGVVVTLDVFTKQAQEEIKDDKLPIILINGKKVSELLLTYINKSGKTLTEIVKEQDEWAKNNLGTLHYDSILNS